MPKGPQAEKIEVDRTESSQQGSDEELTGEQLLALTNLPDPKLPINEPLYSQVSHELSEVNLKKMESAAQHQQQNAANVNNFWKGLAQDAYNFGMNKLAAKHPDRAREVAAGMQIINDVAHPIRTAKELAEGAIIGAATFITDATLSVNEAIDLYKTYNRADPITQGQMEAKVLEGVATSIVPFKTASALKNYSIFKEKGIEGGVRAANLTDAELNPRIEKLIQVIEEFLGKDYKFIKNKKGDPVFINHDNTKRIRFDSVYSHGDAPHGHVEIFRDNDWFDFTDQHRIHLRPIPEPKILPMKKV